MADAHDEILRDQLTHASVLVEIGWLHDAEHAVADILDTYPEALAALSLYAKIKHIRGELSQVIGCWAQMHARSGSHEQATLQLRALLHLAEDPVRSAGEFLVVGKNQLVRKPAAQLALEEAFGLFQAHKPDDARAICVTLAAKYRGEDRDIYKLAVLAIAWIAELSGERDEARVFLERLGKERGFETDTDRLIALERLYEFQDSAVGLKSAVKVCKFLERHLRNEHGADVLWLGKLAVLYRRLGENDCATTYGQRFLAAFRREMLRPTFSETVQMAVTRHIPLVHIRKMRFPSYELRPDAPADQLAVAAVIQGQESGDALERSLSASAIRCKYLGCAAALLGHEKEATRHYLAAIKQDMRDVYVLGCLLESYACHGDKDIASYFSAPDVATHARTLLEEALRKAPLRPSYWRHLATLHEILSEHASEGSGEHHVQATRCAAHSKSLARAAEDRTHAMGRVLSSSVYNFIGRPEGLIHELWAQREPVTPARGGSLSRHNILGNVNADMAEGIRNTFVSVREYAQTKFPHQTDDLYDYTYSFKLPKEDEPSAGLSAGLPTALAFLSVFLQLPIPQDIAFTGILITDAHDVLTIHAVGDIEFKVRAAYHRNLRALMLPRGNAGHLDASARIPAAVVRDLVQYVSNLDEAIRLLWGPDVFGPLIELVRPTGSAPS